MTTLPIPTIPCDADELYLGRKEEDRWTFENPRAQNCRRAEGGRAS